jgi:uncharacterized protein YecE (DUF72 family)
MAGSVRIGTSGWHYKHWLGLFYPKKLPAKEMFAFYARHFDTVEINNSFYRLPLTKTFESWRDNSPANFIYAVKGSRFITHMKKLKDAESSSEKFFDGVERLGGKLGPILFQLPPRWQVNVERLVQFLEALPRQHRYVLEFRDESWLIEEVYSVLRQYNAAFCIHDLARMKTPHEITTDFTYIRFHGPGEAKYQGSYSTRELARWSDRLGSWRKSGIDVYAYFNNDVGGHAITNARSLKDLVALS